ncbi:E3 ubiquitin-protein ligase TRIM32 [Lingula anatina]|uniref:E3 ubiquitin-protein ligase TRIM32 n=1 Tax=Lingula anatina TaxID=7574 RepID=A0A1S3JMH2_LINAN|nr:E3 ubiquitin-protein ligase TRIM32 [Lingula anatina]|eukprot:XP_013411109.1 E3 ubiquitin-protein ligase TRIM32 [Lingula anatina]
MAICHDEKVRTSLALENVSLRGSTKPMMAILQCPICLMQYDFEEHHPRLLSGCGHTVCNACVKLLLAREDPHTASTTCVCLFCKVQSTPVSNDTILNLLRQCMRVNGMDLNVKELSCEECGTKGEVRIYCRTCTSFLCWNCEESHIRVQLLNDDLHDVTLFSLENKDCSHKGIFGNGREVLPQFQPPICAETIDFSL